jgi:hypothetical protein
MVLSENGQKTGDVCCFLGDSMDYAGGETCPNGGLTTVDTALRVLVLLGSK